MDFCLWRHFLDFENFRVFSVILLGFREIFRGIYDDTNAFSRIFINIQLKYAYSEANRLNMMWFHVILLKITFVHVIVYLSRVNMWLVWLFLHFHEKTHQSPSILLFSLIFQLQNHFKHIKITEFTQKTIETTQLLNVYHQNYDFYLNW